MDLSIAAPGTEPRVLRTREDHFYVELDATPDRGHVYVASQPFGTGRTLLQAAPVRDDEDPVLHDVALDGFVMHRTLAPSPEGARMLLAATDDAGCTSRDPQAIRDGSSEICAIGWYLADLSRPRSSVRLDGVEPSATVAWAPDATGVFVSSGEGLDWRTGSGLGDVRELSGHGGRLFVPPAWPDRDPASTAP